MSERYQAYYRIIGSIPEGCVCTYGTIAALAGYPGTARQVGYALAALPEGLEIPWHRVVNSKGEISLDNHGHWGQVQRAMLESEGIQFTVNRRINLKRYGWPHESI